MLAIIQARRGYEKNNKIVIMHIGPTTLVNLHRNYIIF